MSSGGESPSAALSAVWPLFDLRLATDRLQLRPVCEQDLPELAAIRPDPRLPGHAFLDTDVQRLVAMFQSYWQGLGHWTEADWRLDFCVEHEGRLIGMQTLEGREFALRRTAETASWLEEPSQGREFGKEMRAAVLHLAFEGLGAEVAVTEAYTENAASLGVSRSLGYEPNGYDVQVERGEPRTVVRLRMSLAQWLATRAHAVVVKNLDPCLAWFGAGLREG